MAVFVNSEETPIEVEPVLPDFGESLVFIDGAAPVVVADGAYKMKISGRGFAVVVAGDVSLLSTERTRLGTLLKQIAAFEPTTLKSRK